MIKYLPDRVCKKKVLRVISLACGMNISNNGLPICNLLYIIIKLL